MPNLEQTIIKIAQDLAKVSEYLPPEDFNKIVTHLAVHVRNNMDKFSAEETSAVSLLEYLDLYFTNHRFDKWMDDFAGSIEKIKKVYDEKVANYLQTRTTGSRMTEDKKNYDFLCTGNIDNASQGNYVLYTQIDEKLLDWDSFTRKALMDHSGSWNVEKLNYLNDIINENTQQNENDKITQASAILQYVSAAIGPLELRVSEYGDTKQKLELVIATTTSKKEVFQKMRKDDAADIQYQKDLEKYLQLGGKSPVKPIRPTSPSSRPQGAQTVDESLIGTLESGKSIDKIVSTSPGKADVLNTEPDASELNLEEQAKVWGEPAEDESNVYFDDEDFVLGPDDNSTKKGSVNNSVISIISSAVIKCAQNEEEQASEPRDVTENILRQEYSPEEINLKDWFDKISQRKIDRHSKSKAFQTNFDSIRKIRGPIGDAEDLLGIGLTQDPEGFLQKILDNKEKLLSKVDESLEESERKLAFFRGISLESIQYDSNLRAELLSDLVPDEGEEALKKQVGENVIILPGKVITQKLEDGREIPTDLEIERLRTGRDVAIQRLRQDQRSAYDEVQAAQKSSEELSAQLDLVISSSRSQLEHSYQGTDATAAAFAVEDILSEKSRDHAVNNLEYILNGKDTARLIGETKKLSKYEGNIEITDIIKKSLSLATELESISSSFDDNSSEKSFVDSFIQGLYQLSQNPLKTNAQEWISSKRDGINKLIDASPVENKDTVISTINSLAAGIETVKSIPPDSIQRMQQENVPFDKIKDEKELEKTARTTTNFQNYIEVALSNDTSGKWLTRMINLLENNVVIKQALANSKSTAKEGQPIELGKGSTLKDLYDYLIINKDKATANIDRMARSLGELSNQLVSADSTINNALKKQAATSGYLAPEHVFRTNLFYGATVTSSDLKDMIKNSYDARRTYLETHGFTQFDKQFKEWKKEETAKIVDNRKLKDSYEKWLSSAIPDRERTLVNLQEQVKDATKEYSSFNEEQKNSYEGKSKVNNISRLNTVIKEISTDLADLKEHAKETKVNPEKPSVSFQKYLARIGVQLPTVWDFFSYIADNTDYFQGFSEQVPLTKEEQQAEMYNQQNRTKNPNVGRRDPEEPYVPTETITNRPDWVTPKNRQHPDTHPEITKDVYEHQMLFTPEARLERVEKSNKPSALKGTAKALDAVRGKISKFSRNLDAATTVPSYMVSNKEYEKVVQGPEQKLADDYLPMLGKMLTDARKRYKAIEDKNSDEAKLIENAINFAQQRYEAIKSDPTTLRSKEYGGIERQLASGQFPPSKLEEIYRDRKKPVK